MASEATGSKLDPSAPELIQKARRRRVSSKPLGPETWSSRDEPSRSDRRTASGSSRDMMNRSTSSPGAPATLKFTKTGRVSKASKGERVHACEECDKVSLSHGFASFSSSSCLWSGLLSPMHPRSFSIDSRDPHSLYVGLYAQRALEVRRGSAAMSHAGSLHIAAGATRRTINRVPFLATCRDVAGRSSEKTCSSATSHASESCSASLVLRITDPVQ